MEKKSNPSLPTIGLDLMGSDEGSTEVLLSLLPILDSLQHSASFLLFGEEKNRSQLKSIPYVSFEAAQDRIEMDENPLLAVRQKKNSSIHLGIKALQEGNIQAFISKGNTGALMATAKAQLKTLPSIKRPALLALLPTKTREMVVLDVGANTVCKSSHLIEFAAIGIAYQKARIQGGAPPRVGLLNIGVEAMKGTPELREAHKLLSRQYPYFCGNIEARDAFEGHVDVLVTDGFTGNIFLKTAEGIAQLLLSELAALSSVKKIQSRFDYSEYPGAVLTGVHGIVIKCHGSSKPEAFHHSLISAIQLVERNFLDQIKTELHMLC